MADAKNIELVNHLQDISATGKNLLDLSSKEKIREVILATEKKMEEYPDATHGDSDLCPLTHSFAPGVYVRQIEIPAGALIVGKIHKHEHPNFLLKGIVSVLTEEGGIETLEAPLSMISPAGTKRVVMAHTDTIWTTVHVTEERDIDKIEDEIIAKNYLEYESFARRITI